MTTLLSCARVRDRLHALLDGELPAAEHALARTHLADCEACGAALDDYRALGDALRAGFDRRAVPSDALAALEAMTSRVVSLTAAEARQSLGARLGRAFEDMRFVFAGAGSFAATFLCTVGLAVVLQAASISNAESLAAQMDRMGAPRGSTQNPFSVDPRLLPPVVRQDSLIMPGVLVDDVPYLLPDEQYAFSGVLTSEGRVAGIGMLQSGAVIDERAMELLRSIHESRFEPARLRDGRAVAVSFVWLHSDVTIRAGKSL
jgi:hypothetical protein